MTLKRLSDHLGLSKTTVSRALAGYSDVSAATRKRVQAAADKLGYRPNPLAQRLRMGRMYAVCMVLPTGPGDFADPFLLQLMGAAGRGLAAHGIDLIVTAAAPGEGEMEALRRMVEARRADAAIVVRTRHRDPRIEYLLDREFPFVSHGRTEGVDGYAFVDVDGEDAFRRACSFLIDLGHRRIGYVGTPMQYSFSRHRRQGYLAALADRGIDIDETLILEIEHSEQGGYDGAGLLTGRGPVPTAVLCATDIQAMGCMRALTNAGIRVGVDIAVMGFDDLPTAGLTIPALTTMAQPTERLGRRLAEIALAVAEGAVASEFQELWTADLIERQSTCPPPAS